MVITYLGLLWFAVDQWVLSLSVDWLNNLFTAFFVNNQNVLIHIFFCAFAFCFRWLPLFKMFPRHSLWFVVFFILAHFWRLSPFLFISFLWEIFEFSCSFVGICQRLFLTFDFKLKIRFDVQLTIIFGVLELQRVIWIDLFRLFGANDVVSIIWIIISTNIAFAFLTIWITELAFRAKSVVKSLLDLFNDPSFCTFKFRLLFACKYIFILRFFITWEFHLVSKLFVFWIFFI